MRESVVIDLIPVNVKDLRSRRSLICHLDARRSRGPRAHRSVRWALVYTGYAAGTELTTLDLCCITDYNPPRLAISAWTRLLFGFWTRLLFGAPGRRCHAGRGSCDSRLAPDRSKFGCFITSVVFGVTVRYRALRSSVLFVQRTNGNATRNGNPLMRTAVQRQRSTTHMRNLQSTYGQRATTSAPTDRARRDATLDPTGHGRPDGTGQGREVSKEVSFHRQRLRRLKTLQ